MPQRTNLSQQLTIDETALLLGVSKFTLYRWAKDRKIPYMKLPGNDIRFDAERLASWMEIRTIKPKST